MKIAFCLSDKSPVSELDQRFGRCSWFLISDDSGEVGEVLENMGKEDAHGAGTGVVKFLANHDVDTIVAPRLGPKAFQAIEAFGIKGWHQGECATAQEALLYLKKGKLEAMTSPMAQGLHKI